MTQVITVDRERPLLPEPSEGLMLPTPRSVYRWAIGRGWPEAAAGNLAAMCAGITLADEDELPAHAWTIRQVEHLAFLRELVGSGQLTGDTEAAE